MKKTLMGIMGIMGVMGVLAQGLQYVDTTTRTTNTSSSMGYLSLTNPAGGMVVTHAGYTTTNPAYMSIGDFLPVAFGKLNNDILYLSTAMRTNGAAANGMMPVTSNNVPGGVAWVPMGTGGGGTTYTNTTASAGVIGGSGIGTNLSGTVGSNGGEGTNVNFSGVTTFDNATAGAGVYPNLFIYAAVTNLIPWMTSDTTPFGLLTTPPALGFTYPWNIFDGPAHGFAANDYTGTNVVEYDFPTPVTAVSFQGMINGDSNNCILVFQYSTNSGTSWTTIQSLTGQFSSATNTVINFFAITAADWRWTISTTNLSHDGWFGASDWGLYPQQAQSFVSSYMFNNGSSDETDDTMVMNAIGGVAINMNYAGGYGLNVDGGINCTGGFFSNGVPVAGLGGSSYTNTTARAGVVSPGGIGTNLPTPYYAITAGTATNDPNGNPLISWPDASNLVVSAAGLYIGNSNGVGTNLTVYVYSTDITNLLTIRTNNAGIIRVKFQDVYSLEMMIYDTNELVLFNSTAPLKNPNQTYYWNSIMASYTNNANDDYVAFQASPNNNWCVFMYGTVFYTNAPQGHFPYNWGVAYIYGGPPSGYFPFTTVVLETVTNTWWEVFNTNSPMDLGGHQYALTVNGRVNASGYAQGGTPLLTVLQGMMYPYLWVTNCAAAATNLQGAFANTGQGYYTNLVNGVLLIPAGYYGTGLNVTNFSTSVSLLCSNWTSLNAGETVFADLTNGVLGYYTPLQIGPDNMGTNAPFVSLYTPPLGVTTNVVIQTNATGPHGWSLFFTNGLFQGTTPY